MSLLTESRVFFKKNLLPFLCGVFAGLLVCFLGSALFSFLLSFSPIVSFSVIRFFSVITVLVCSFVSGFVTVQFKEKNGFVYGGLAGALLFVLMAFIGGFFAQTIISGFTFLRLVIFIVLGSLGGIVSINKCH